MGKSIVDSGRANVVKATLMHNTKSNKNKVPSEPVSCVSLQVRWAPTDLPFSYNTHETMLLIDARMNRSIVIFRAQN